MGMALADPGNDLPFVQYFLDPSNHQPAIPLDYISYHFYAVPSSDQTVDDWQYSFFKQADAFLNTVRSIETIRKNLAPQTKTDIDELGSILPTDNTPADVVPDVYKRQACSRPLTGSRRTPLPPEAKFPEPVPAAASMTGFSIRSS